MTDGYIEPEKEVAVNPDEMKPAPEMTKEERRQQTDRYTVYRGYTRKPPKRFNAFQKKKVDAWQKHYGVTFPEDMNFDDISFEVFKIRNSMKKQSLVISQLIVTKKQEIKAQFQKERRDKIMELRRKAMSLGEIGREFGVSRERIRQIVLSFSQEDQLEFFKLYKEVAGRRKLPRVDVVCPVCSKVFQKLHTVTKKWCSVECSQIGRGVRYPVPKEVRQTKDKLLIQRYRYNNYPEYRKIQNTRTYAGVKKRLADPAKRQELLDKQKVYGKRWFDKMKADPVRWAAYKEKHKDDWKKSSRSLKLLQKKAI